MGSCSMAGWRMVDRVGRDAVGHGCDGSSGTAEDGGR
jgi:hypothetical protein